MKRNLIRFFLFTFLASGCAGIPQTHYYVLHLNTHSPNPVSSAITIGIAPFTIEPIFSNYKIAYRESPYEVQFYNYHQWASEPSKLVENGLFDYLTHSNQFNKVVRLPSIQTIDLVIDGHIHKIEEWDETDRWYGFMEIEFQVSKYNKKQIIWKGTISRRIPAESKKPLEVVKALSIAAQEIAEELSQKILAAYHLAEK